MTGLNSQGQFLSQIFSRLLRKILAKVGPNGEPIATPSIHHEIKLMSETY